MYPTHNVDAWLRARRARHAALVRRRQRLDVLMGLTAFAALAWVVATPIICWWALS